MPGRALVAALASLATALMLAGCAPAPRPGDVIEHPRVAGFDQETDLYRVPEADTAIVVLHGGGGSKTGMPYQVALSDAAEPTQASIQWDWLRAHRVMVAFPQGGRSTNGRGSWSNGLTAGGPDDTGFLEALAAQLRREHGVRQVVLTGHSAGGIMASGLWCRTPSAYDAYVTFSGPPIAALGTMTPCAPAQPAPLLAVIGSDDEAIIAGAGWDAPTWQMFGTRASPVPGLTRVLYSEPAALAWRAGIMCGGSPGAPIASGRTTRWQACDGRLQLVRAEGAHHALNTQADALDPSDHLALLDTVLAFARR